MRRYADYPEESYADRYLTTAQVRETLDQLAAAADVNRRQRSPRSKAGFTSSHASGAPSEPCLGASSSVRSVERMCPIGLSK